MVLDKALQKKKEVFNLGFLHFLCREDSLGKSFFKLKSSAVFYLSCRTHLKTGDNLPSRE